MIEEMLPDQLRKNVNCKIRFPAVIFTPEILGQVRVVVLLFAGLILVQSIRHFEIVIPRLFNLFLSAIRNAFNDQVAVLDLSFNVCIVHSVNDNFPVMPFKIGLVVLISDV